MSTRYASQANVLSKQNPDAPRPVNTITGASWTRPADWTALPSITSSDTKFVGLVAVTDDSTNFLTFSATGTGLSYNIDWGDGTTQTGVGTGTVLQKTYNYTTLSSSVSSLGYKMAVVTVTVTSAASTWTGFSLINAPTNIGPATNYAFKWLDIAFSGSSLTTYSISNTTNTVTASMLQQINIVSANTFYVTWLGGSTTTNGATSLQSIILNNISTPITGLATAFANTKLKTGVDLSGLTFAATTLCGNMYNNCVNLVTVPDFPSTLKPSDITSIFSGCTSLKTVPKIDLSSCTLASSAFASCTNLISCPNLYMPNCTNILNLFSGCTSLITAPVIQANPTGGQGSVFSGCSSMTSCPSINMGTAVDINNMFQNCGNLKTIGVITATSITSANLTFQGCSSLVSIGGLNFGTSLTSITSIFSGCTQLTSIPPFNTSNITNYTSAFLNCISLSALPIGFDTIKATTMTGTFNGCSSLTSIPSLNTSNVTLLNAAFANCYSLPSIPLLDTSNVTSFNGTFLNCYSLASLPTFDMTKNTNLANTFQGCTSLTTIPTFNTSNVTSTSGMLNSATSISVVPLIDTSKCTTVTGMFLGCASLSTVPALNLGNVTTAALTGFAGLPALSNIQITGLKQAHSIANDKLGKTELENYFANYIGIPAGSTALTITNNPGADTANAKTSGTTAGSNVVTMANTVGIIAGSTFLYGTGMNTGIPVTFTDSTDTVVYTNGGGLNGLANGDNVLFTTITSTTGIVINTRYWVVNRTGTTFQVSATSGGSALPLTTNGTGVMSIGGATISNRVVTVNANANVIINGVSGITNAAAALTARNLNVNQAVTKNWAITG